MQDFRKIKDLDDVGLLVAPSDKPLPIYDFKAMTEYCRLKGIAKADLTDEERDQFILYWS